MDITVTIPDEGKKVLESWLGVDQIQPWLQHAIDNKLRERLDATILEVTAYNPEKMKTEYKLNILEKVKLLTREERDGLLLEEKGKKEK